MKLIRGRVTDALGIESEVVNFGSANIISGGNATGKTSWVDIIEKGLYNNERRDKFVRTGAEKAYIELETDDGIKVSRVVSEDGTTADLKVTRDGIPVRSPQTFLDQLFGVTKERKDVFAFNPVDFMGKSAKEQAKILLALMPIIITQQNMMEWFGKVPPVNPNQHGLLVLKELEKYWYDARREANGAVKATAAEVEAVQNQLPDNYDVAAWENFSTMKLSDEIRNGEQVNNFRKQAQEIIYNLDATKEGIENKYNLALKNLDEKYVNLAEEIKIKAVPEKEELEIKIDGLKVRATDAVKIINQQIEALKTNNTERKTEINKEIADLEQRIALLRQELGQLDGNLESAIQIKLSEITNVNNKLNLCIENTLNSIKGIDDRVNAEIEGLGGQKEIEAQNLNSKKEIENNAADERVKKSEKYLEENPETEIQPLNEKYAEAEKMKGFVEMAHNLQKVQERLLKETELAEKYDTFVELCRAKPRELLKTMQMPVEGISIYFNVDDNNDKANGTLLFDGLTLKNLNTAQQIKKCIDIAKAYADGTVLKLIEVDRLESLDADAKKEFYRNIRSNPNYQFIVTTVTNGKRVMDIIDVEYMDDNQFEEWLKKVV